MSQFFTVKLNIPTEVNNVIEAEAERRSMRVESLCVLLLEEASKKLSA